MSRSSVGLPSTHGGMIVLMALVAWAAHPLLVAMIRNRDVEANALLDVNFARVTNDRAGFR